MSASAWLYQAPRIRDEIRDGLWNEPYESRARANGARAHPGDTIFYWNSGSAAGVYAVGTVIGEPHRTSGRRKSPTSRQFAIPSKLEASFLANPLLRDELMAHPQLRTLDILRRPFGANLFSITPTQFRALRKLTAAAARSQARRLPRLEPPNDELDRQLTARRVRRGQARLRERLLEEYAHRCAVTYRGPESVLEACHIRSHSASGENDSRNGLLLRSDIHVLFDLRLLKVNPVTLRVHLDKTLARSGYGYLQGRRILTRRDNQRPNKAALAEVWEEHVIRE